MIKDKIGTFLKLGALKLSSRYVSSLTSDQPWSYMQNARSIFVAATYQIQEHKAPGDYITKLGRSTEACP
jgi:hypothetical protein